MPLLTPGLREYLATLDPAAYDRQAVARRFGCDPRTVGWIWLNRHRIVRDQVGLEALLRSPEGAALTYDQIADRTGYPRSTVGEIARRLGIVRSRGRRLPARAYPAPADPLVAVRLAVAAVYLAALNRPCQCAHR